MQLINFIGLVLLGGCLATAAPASRSPFAETHDAVLKAFDRLGGFMTELRANLTDDLSALRADTVAARRQLVLAGASTLDPFDALLSEAVDQVHAQLHSLDAKMTEARQRVARSIGVTAAAATAAAAISAAAIATSSASTAE